MAEEKRKLDAFIAAEMKQYGTMTKALDLKSEKGRQKMQELQDKMKKRIQEKKNQLGYDY
jgi:hypothetical protein